MAEPHVAELLKVSLHDPDLKRKLGVTYHIAEVMGEVVLRWIAKQALDMGWDGTSRPNTTEEWDAIKELIPESAGPKTVKDFIDAMRDLDTRSWVELSDFCGKRVLIDGHAYGRRMIGTGTAAQLYRVCVRCGFTPSWSDAEPQWIEGHSNLGRTGISTKPMSADRIGRLSEIRTNIVELEAQLVQQRNLHTRLVSELRAELDAAERAAQLEFEEELPIENTEVPDPEGPTIRMDVIPMEVGDE